jgi:tRNA-2-methylthio-N6-dimethylallyladenosine synthase
MTKKAYIKTYGCQMNVYDSQRMSDVLASMGYSPSPGPEEADLVILNTCHIREKAAEKVYSEIGSLRRLKKTRAGAGLDTIVAIAGCVAQAEGEEMLRRAPAVDLVIGPQIYHRLPELVTRFVRDQRADCRDGVSLEDKFDRLAQPAPHVTRARGVTAFLTCRKGATSSAPSAWFLIRAAQRFRVQLRRSKRRHARLPKRACARSPCSARTSTPIMVGGPDGEIWSLARLARQARRYRGIERLRFTTSHPRDMSEDLIAAFRHNAKLMPYLHLPVQSGSDRILKAMNRRHRVRDYLRLIERIRSSRSDIAVSGDFIVGFPGETEEDFAATLELVRKVEYASAFSFKYSPRPGTPAAEMAFQIDDASRLSGCRSCRTCFIASGMLSMPLVLAVEWTFWSRRPGATMAS